MVSSKFLGFNLTFNASGRSDQAENYSILIILRMIFIIHNHILVRSEHVPIMMPLPSRSGYPGVICQRSIQSFRFLVGFGILKDLPLTDPGPTWTDL